TYQTHTTTYTNPYPLHPSPPPPHTPPSPPRLTTDLSRDRLRTPTYSLRHQASLAVASRSHHARSLAGKPRCHSPRQRLWNDSRRRIASGRPAKAPGRSQ